MRVLVVFDHPITGSFTSAVAAAVGRGASSAGATVEIANIASEGFDGSMTGSDLGAFRGRRDMPDDVLAEQRRVDRADALVFVFPIYWWSLPARLKGWLDRVLTSGWAYDDRGDAIEGRLQDRPVYLFAIGATDQEAFERHGYLQAFETQIVRGIFGYCGLKNVSLHLLLESDAMDPGPRKRHLQAAFQLGAGLSDHAGSLARSVQGR